MRALVALSLVAGGGVLALYFLVVRTYWGQRLDEHAFAGRSVADGLPGQGADELLSTISVGTLILAIGAVTALALLRRDPRLVVLPIVVIAGSLAVTEVLKLELLSRPLLAPSAVLDNSYPSGHTTIGIAVGLAALLIAPPRLRIAAALGAALLAAAIGVATVAAGWHRPSDAVAAYLVAVSVAAGATAATLTWLPAGASAGDTWVTRPATWRPRIGAPEAVLGVIAVGAIGLFGLAVLRTSGVPWTSAGVSFLLSAAAIAAAAAICVAATAWALERATPGRLPTAGLDDR